MEILTFNVLWMVWNSFLAILPVGFAFLYFKTHRTLYKAALAVLWLLFFPNALYVMTDIEHIIYQWPMLGIVERFFALIQYVHLEVIGLTAFIISLYAFEKEIRRILHKSHRKLVPGIVISLNFLTGFAMIMGKVERVNSWEVFTNIENVIAAVFNVLSSDQLVGLAILFGLFGNFFYFLLRDPVIKYFRNYARSQQLTNAGRVI